MQENERLTNGRRRYMLLGTLEQYKKKLIRIFSEEVEKCPS